MIRDTSATDRSIQVDAKGNTQRRMLIAAAALIAVLLVGWSV